MRPDRYAARDINARDPSTAVFNDPKTCEGTGGGNMANVTSNCSVIHFVSCFIASPFELVFFFYLSFYFRLSLFISFLHTSYIYMYILMRICISCLEDMNLLRCFFMLTDYIY